MRVISVILGFSVALSLAGCSSDSSSPDLPGLPPVASPAPLPEDQSLSESPNSNPSQKGSKPKPEAKPSRPVVTKAGVLKRNKLYVSGKVPNGNCATQSTVPLDTPANLKKYYGSVLRCLNASWKKLDGKAFKFKPAKLVIHSGENVSACGAVQYSFYCTSENTIFMYAPEINNPWREFQGNEVAYRNIRLSAAHTIAHEYGHHVQNLTYIFRVLLDSGYRGGGDEERRLELQASCLGEAWMGANSSRYPVSQDALNQAQYWRYILLPAHGSQANQKYWGDRGLVSAKPGSCNTWVASKKRTA